MYDSVLILVNLNIRVNNCDIFEFKKIIFNLFDITFRHDTEYYFQNTVLSNNVTQPLCMLALFITV